MAKILLIEADYKNKYPPLGLMKLSTYHKQLGDEVVFYKGKNKDYRNSKWDRIYITTLFTFYWKKTIETIKYYLDSVESPDNIYIGGIMATILHDELLKEGFSEINIIRGLLDKPGILNNDNIIIDTLAPDYSILETDEVQKYKYPLDDAYIAYTTRGCVNKCSFCVVPILEPKYKDYISIKEQVETIKSKYGEKRDLLLLDNNVLASNKFNEIIEDIIDLGYGINENIFTYINENGRKVSRRRYVDFNQGIDARLVDDENMKQLSRIAIKPLRIAFDHADDKYVKIYTDAVKMAAANGIKNLSNYILFNFKDNPEEFYKRLNINIKLNEEFENNKDTKGVKIFSFPMRYSPIQGKHSTDRKFVGEHWTPKYIRSIQCILAATHGVVGPKRGFFNKAFGEDINAFNKLLIMPEDYIVYRDDNKNLGNTDQWWEDYQRVKDKSNINNIINSNKFKNLDLSLFMKEEKKVLIHYIHRKKK